MLLGATTNKSATAITYISRIQGAHEIQRAMLLPHSQWIPDDGKVFTLYMVTVWHNKIQIYKPYFLAFIPTMFDSRRTWQSLNKKLITSP